MNIMPIKNKVELQIEKGVYYPYIMQIMGAPVINGVLICATNLKYFHNYLIPGIAETLIIMTNKKTGKRIFNKLDKDEFKYSFLNALADLFYGGCEPDDYDEEEAFAYFDKWVEEYDISRI